MKLIVYSCCGSTKTTTCAGLPKLLGILYASTMYTAKGEIQIVAVPTTNIPVSITQIPNNSRNILELEKELFKVALERS